MDPISRDAPLLSIAEVAKRLGVHRASVYRMLADGLKWVQLLGVRRVSQEDLAEYIRKHTHYAAR